MYINNNLPLDERFMVMMCNFVLAESSYDRRLYQVAQQAQDILYEIQSRDDEVNKRKDEVVELWK